MNFKVGDFVTLKSYYHGNEHYGHVLHISRIECWPHGGSEQCFYVDNYGCEGPWNPNAFELAQGGVGPW